MKKMIVLVILLMGAVLPWACSDNKTPSSPGSTSPGSGSSFTSTFTPTPTGTITPGTPTNTPTIPVGAPTSTPTATFALTPASFVNNYYTTTGPRGMALNGTLLTVAESGVTTTGIASAMEVFTGAGTSTLNLYNCCPTGSGTVANVGNIILVGAAPTQTPGATPVAFSPTTITLHQVQGFVNPGGNSAGGWSAVLDLSGGGPATLYTGYYSSWSSTAPPQGPNYMPFFGPDYSGIPFNNPQAICDDGTGSTGHVYVADTGNATVDELSPYEGSPGLEPIPIHYWTGAEGVSISGGVTFQAASVTFKSPTAVACDSSGNVWVGDQGYLSTVGTSYISEYASGATTILQNWKAIPGCKVSGLAVGPTGNIYVADAGNYLVEIYSTTGTLLSEIIDPGPAAHNLYPFLPTCVAFSGGYIYVGDINNNYIDVFQ